MRVFENRVLRRIFVTTWDEVTGEWRKDIVRSLMICMLTQYCSGDKIEKNGMGAAFSTYRERRGACRLFVGET